MNVSPTEYVEDGSSLHHSPLYQSPRITPTGPFRKAYCPDLGAFAKLRKATISFVLSVSPHRTTRLRLDEFSCNFLFELFFLRKTCRENWSFIIFWQEQRVLHMKTYVHSCQYLAEFFLKWETFHTILVDKIKIHISRSITFSPQNRTVYETMWEKYCTARHATHNNIICRMRSACWITHTHTHTHRLRTCNTYRFSTATVVTWTRLNVTLHILCLPCWHLTASQHYDNRIT